MNDTRFAIYKSRLQQLLKEASNFSTSSTFATGGDQSLELGGTAAKSAVKMEDEDEEGEENDEIDEIFGSRNSNSLQAKKGREGEESDSSSGGGMGDIKKHPLTRLLYVKNCDKKITGKSFT